MKAAYSLLNLTLQKMKESEHLTFFFKEKLFLKKNILILEI